jgi:hypothetical protein
MIKEKISDLRKHNFKTKSCTNCKHNGTCEIQYVLIKGVTNPSFMKKFACNMWEETK